MVYAQDAALQVGHIIEQIECPSKVHFLTFKMTYRLLYITLQCCNETRNQEAQNFEYTPMVLQIFHDGWLLNFVNAYHTLLQTEVCWLCGHSLKMGHLMYKQQDSIEQIGRSQIQTHILPLSIYRWQITLLSWQNIIHVDHSP